MGAPHLRCNDPLTNFKLYLALNQDISFVVFRNFKRQIERQSHNTKYGKPEPFSESIYPLSDDLKEVVQEFLGGEEFQYMREDYEQMGEVQSPYLFIYHNRGVKESELRQGLYSEARTQMDLLMNYVQETRGIEYAAADSLLNRGKICPEYVQYLFRPDDVLVSPTTKNTQAMWQQIGQLEAFKSVAPVPTILQPGQSWLRLGNLMVNSTKCASFSSFKCQSPSVPKRKSSSHEWIS